MKLRLFSFFLMVLILLPILGGALADTQWYCPQCGRLNNSNFCPFDGTARPTWNSPANTYTQYAYASAKLNSKLATRTGPGTQYDEPGTFLSKGSWVTILSKAYDSRNNIWWVQVEFTEARHKYRAYTGVKRFDGLNLNAIPEEGVIGSCTVSQTITGYYGPGYDYRAIGQKVPSGVSCAIYGRAYGDNGDFFQVEFFDQARQRTRRAWIPAQYAANCLLY